MGKQTQICCAAHVFYALSQPSNLNPETSVSPQRRLIVPINPKPSNVVSEP